MQRCSGRYQDDEDTYYDAKYGKYGSLGRKESMGRYRKYQPTKSSSGAITFGSPRLMQRSIALSMASDQNNLKHDGRLNTNLSDNLFTDTGSPRYVNTSAILGQNPHKQGQRHHQYSDDGRNRNRNARSPVVGRRDLQQQEFAKENFPSQISKNLNNEFSKYGPAGNKDSNNKLLPVTTIQQVLYNNNGSQNGLSLGASLPQQGNGQIQGPSPIQKQPAMSQMAMNNGHLRPGAHINNLRSPSGVAHNMGNNEARNHSASSTSTTSSSLIPSLQKSAGVPDMANNSRSGGDRVILEQNLEKLITQKGLEVLGQLTAEMTHEQIERLLQKTKEKLGNNAASQSTGMPMELENLETSAVSRSRRPLDIDFTRNHDLDGYLSQQLQVAPVPAIPPVSNSHHRYGSQSSCPAWTQEGDSFNSTPRGSKIKSPDLSKLKFMPQQGMNGTNGEESSSNEDEDTHRDLNPRKGHLVNNNNHPYQGNNHPSNRKHHQKHPNERLNISFNGEVMGAKNLSVRFDPSQDPTNMANQPPHRPTYQDYPASPYMEQRSRHHPPTPQGYPHPHHQRSHSTSHSHHHHSRHHHHHHYREHQKPFHQRSSSSTRQPQTTSTPYLQNFRDDYNDGHPNQAGYNHQPISRSHSYSSGQAGFANSAEPHRGGGGGYPYPLPNTHSRNQSPNMMMPPHSAMRGQTPNTRRKHGRNVAFHDDEDGRCPTCSSDSSSDSDDDPYAYQPAPRKAYGGVRLSYVPNDRRRAKLMSDPRLEYVPRNLHNKHHQSARAGSLQPQSLPPNGARSHMHTQQTYHQQQNGGMFIQQQPNNMQQAQHKLQQHPHQTHQIQTPYFPSQPGHHRNPQNGSAVRGGDPKDKDKNCVIS